MIKLATEIVILLTTLVGLYKVARFTPKQTEPNGTQHKQQSSGNQTSSGLLDFFKPLLEIIGILAAIIAFPLFIWAFMWIMNNMFHVYDRDIPKNLSISSISQSINEPDLNIKKTDLPPNAIQSFYLLKISEHLTHESDRNDILKRAANIALEDGAPNIAIIAANNISNSTEKNELLKNIVENTVELNDIDYSLEALSLISSTNLKNDVAQIIVNKILSKKIKNNSSDEANSTDTKSSKQSDGLSAPLYD